MSDQGGTPEAGWYADPNGRHEYRYWDGTTWSDQVSDGGVVSTDPPGEAPTAVTSAVTESVPAAGPPVAGVVGGPPTMGDQPYVAPMGTSEGGRKLPVGVLALAGLAVAAVVIAVVLLVTGGDDGGGDSENASDTASDALTDDLSDLSDLSDASDFTDFSDFSDDFSDLSDLSDVVPDFSDFSDFTDLSDFSDLFSDFSDFSDLIPDIPGSTELGDPQDPADFIPDYGSNAQFTDLADSCFDGNLGDCDQLYAVTPIDPSTNSWEGYGATCGGRLPEEHPGQCQTLG